MASNTIGGAMVSNSSMRCGAFVSEPVLSEYSSHGDSRMNHPQGPVWILPWIECILLLARDASPAPAVHHRDGYLRHQRADGTQVRLSLGGSACPARCLYRDNWSKAHRIH